MGPYDGDQTSEEYLKSFGDTPGPDKAVDQMTTSAIKLNQQFGQSRQRLSEIITTLNEAAPRITRLGVSSAQSMTEAQNALSEISSTLGRNVLTSYETVEKLYATSQVLNTNVSTLASNFREIGVQASQIGPQLEESVLYVQNLGLNVSSVMNDVLNYTSMINKYNFSDGVQGITKMAAKAAMLKVDMGSVFTLAEEAMKPEGAIKLASAFQRLGVASGNLVDPFALMNESINDPGALQDSIANIAKQYTYFDDKTKSFKINPQGLLMLREIAGETNLSYDMLTKAGLAASELDARLSQISPSIKFKDESDKQFLSNLSEMNVQGEYVVKIKDDEGKIQTKKLSDITQKEFDKLIDEQKSGPKTMEEIARAQLTHSAEIASDMRSVKEAFIRGAVDIPFIKENLEDFRKLTSTTLGPISDELAKTEIFTKQFGTATDSIREAVSSLISSKGQNFGDVMSKLGTRFGAQGEDIQRVVAKLSTNIYQKIKDKDPNFGQSEVGKLSQYAASELKEFEQKYTKLLGLTTKAPTATKGAVSASPSILYGTQTGQIPTATTTQNIKQAVDYSGTITFKVDAPPGVSVQYLTDYVNGEKFKELIYKHIQEKNKDLGLIK